MQTLKFICPKCGGTDIQEVADATTTCFIKIGVDGLLLESTNFNITYEQVDFWECPHCYWVLQDDFGIGDNIGYRFMDIDELADWLKRQPYNQEEPIETES